MTKQIVRLLQDSEAKVEPTYQAESTDSGGTLQADAYSFCPVRKRPR
jgi:hypothetical protein